MDGSDFPRTRIADVLNFIRACNGDLAMLAPVADCLKAEAPTLFAPPTITVARYLGLPAISGLSAMQVSVFDNRLKVKRKRGETDHGLAIECWTDGEAPTELNRIKLLNVKLWSAKEMRYKLKRMEANSCSDDWKQIIADFVEAHGDDWLMGPVIEMKPVFKYIEGQFCVCRMEGGRPVEVRIYSIDDGRYDVTGFVECYASGMELKRGVMASARLTSSDRPDDGWSTQVLANVT
jgi:hypothetical protein